MLRARAVTFLEEGEPNEPTVPTSFRAPESIKKYVMETAKQRRREQTDVWVEGIRFYRDLGSRLAPLMDRIKVFARSEGLDSVRQLPDVLARIIERGLQDFEALEKRPKK